MSEWRKRLKVHPAADVFPMMTDDELATLGEDIKENGLKSPITFCDPPDGEYMLVDGRNRLEAMERAGIDYREGEARNISTIWSADPVAYIISLNIHRRHLSKQQQADLIVAALKSAEAPRQDGEVPKRHIKGKPGSEKDAVKEKAVATGKEHGVSQRTIERSFAKIAEPKPEPPQAKRITARPMPKPKHSAVRTGIDVIRQTYLDKYRELDAEQRDAEWEILITEMKSIQTPRRTH